mgnify:FL=1
MEAHVETLGKEVNRLQQYISDQIPAITAFGLKVVISLVVFFVGVKVIQWVLKFLRRSMGRANIDAGVGQFTCSFSRIVLYVLLIFNIAVNFGLKESSVAALLGTAGVTIGLGLQGGLTNLAGGLMLLIFKPFQVGDYIIQDVQNGCEGTVYKIEMCYTTLLTVDNRSVVIPNGILSNSTIINVTAQKRRKLEIKVGISYESDLKKAKEILRRLLEEEERLQTDEDTLVFVDSLGESTVVLALRSWVDTEHYWSVKWRLNERIKEEFDAHGIAIAYPQMDVHVHTKE